MRSRVGVTCPVSLYYCLCHRGSKICFSNMCLLLSPPPFSTSLSFLLFPPLSPSLPLLLYFSPSLSPSLLLSPLSSLSFTLTDFVDEDDDFLERCIACGGAEGDLVHCGGYDCERVFHLTCMGLDGAPPSKWLCADCQEANMVSE